MSQSFNVSVVEDKTQVFVGPGEKTKDNKVTIKIVSKTDKMSIKKLRVSVEVGDGETALVSATTGLTLVGKSPSQQLDISGNQPDDSSYSWNIEYGNRGFKVDATDGLVLTLTGIVSETNRGSAKVELCFDLTGNAVDSAEVAIQKQQDEKRFEIVRFTATPLYLPSSGGKVTFSWSVNQATSVELRRDGVVLTNGDEDNTTQTGFEDYPPKDGENKYLLVAKRTGQPDITREMVVRREKPGWHSLDYSDSYGEPTTLIGELAFGTDTTPSMAAIFIKDGQARLYRSQSGTGVWLEESSNVPAGMETSPGVVFDKKLWLLGGSAVHPDQRSDRIWCYTTAGGWQEWNHEAKRFSRRMGHACVEFNEKLWVLGGFDENGNACSDVWQLAKGGEQAWQEVTKGEPPWPGRCMFGAAVWNNSRLVVFGGVKEPFGAGLMDLHSCSREGEWATEVAPQVTDAEYALASAVSAMGQDFWVGATYLVKNVETPRFFTWSRGRKGFSSFDKPREPSLETFGVVSYSLAATYFRGRLFLRALADRSERTRILRFYVPRR